MPSEHVAAGACVQAAAALRGGAISAHDRRNGVWPAGAASSRVPTSTPRPCVPRTRSARADSQCRPRRSLPAGLPSGRGPRRSGSEWTSPTRSSIWSETHRSYGSAGVGRDLSCQLLAKVEMVNPGGSVKDRPAIVMIDAAEEAGLLQPGGTIVEPTSGNTGVGLAIVVAQRGYHCIFVMSDKMSNEKVGLLRAYGAEVVVCPTAVPPEDPRSDHSTAERLVREVRPVICPDQYSNQANPRSHELTTGPEIWRQTGGRITHFVAGIGTGGTITGVARYLKSRNPGVQIIGADPEGTAFGRIGPAVPRRGRGRGFLAHHLRPGPRRPRRGPPTPTRSSPPAGSRCDEGLLYRRFARHRGARGARGRSRARPGGRRGRAAARFRAQLPLEDLRRPVDARQRLPARPSARVAGDVLEARSGTPCPPLVRVHARLDRHAKRSRHATTPRRARSSWSRQPGAAARRRRKSRARSGSSS